MSLFFLVFSEPTKELHIDGRREFKHIYLFHIGTSCQHLDFKVPSFFGAFSSRTTYTQWIHKSKKSENLCQWGRQNMLLSYLKIEYGHVVKLISSPGVCSPWLLSKPILDYICSAIDYCFQTPRAPLEVELVRPFSLSGRLFSSGQL